jgi:polyhydroxyalkanoate synthase
MSPSNVPWLNPEVIEATRASGGANLKAGMRNFLEDHAAVHGGAPRVEPPLMGAPGFEPLCDAPGTYVRER